MRNPFLHKPNFELGIDTRPTTHKGACTQTHTHQRVLGFQSCGYITT